MAATVAQRKTATAVPAANGASDAAPKSKPKPPVSNR